MTSTDLPRRSAFILPPVGPGGYYRTVTVYTVEGSGVTRTRYCANEEIMGATPGGAVAAAWLAVPEIQARLEAAGYSAQVVDTDAGEARIRHFVGEINDDVFDSIDDLPGMAPAGGV